jgi:hypothetical protein
LRALCEKGREAFFAGTIDASTALLIARIPSEKLQKEAAAEVADRELSYRYAVDLVQREYMLRLSEAPFSPARADLLPAAGACTTCPARSGNQAELFADVTSADVCTDTPCFGKKVDAAWKERKAQAKSLGQTVLEGKAAEAAAYSYGTDYVVLDGKCFDDHQRQRTYRKILGKDLDLSQVTVARKGNRFVELIDKKLAEKVSRSVRPKPAKAEKREPSPEANEYRRRNEISELMLARAISLAQERKAEILASDEVLWRLLAQEEECHTQEDDLCALLDVPVSDDVEPRDAFAQWLKSATLPAMKAFVVSGAIRRSFDLEESFLASALAELGVTVEDLREQVTAEYDAAQAAETPKKGRGKKAKASAGAEGES